ncbi:MAG: polysaccharide deacetylase family protein [Cyclobacteriaceae bacterium]
MYFFKTPGLLELLYPQALWHGDRDKKKIYLTFDDGPVPGVTDYILDVLSELDVKATFFCVGENIKKNPEVFKRIVQEKHGIGNHTFNHLNGWAVRDEDYLRNIQLCDDMIRHYAGEEQIKLFRPPYGKIRRKVLKKIRHDYKVIMWDVLSYDFSPDITAEKSLYKSSKCSRNGSIIIFHDSKKTFEKLKLIISQYILYFKNINYEFCNVKDIYLQR